MRAADELLQGFDVRDATWAVLADHYRSDQLTEIPFVVGQYVMLSMVANTAQVGLPAGLRPLPDPPWTVGPVSPSARR